MMARGYLILLNEKSQGYGMHESLALSAVTEGAGVLQDVIDSLDRQNAEHGRLIGRRDPQQAIEYCEKAKQEVEERWQRKEHSSKG